MAGRIKSLILDLDGTIVDSSSLDELRERRSWKRCVASLDRTVCFGDLRDVIEQIRSHNIRIGVVTSSVSYYAENVLRYHGIAYDCLIAYHDASPRKPHPAPVLACLRELDTKASDALALGDSEVDCRAYQAAGVIALGAGWSPKLIRSVNWNRIVREPSELLALCLR